MALPSEPLPLFSPTQIPVSGSDSEHVLHSIFSPNLHGGVTSVNMRSRHETEKREQQKREKIALAAKRLKQKTPVTRHSESTMYSNKTQYEQAGGSPDEFFSPVGHNTLPIIPGTVSKATLKTPANLARSAFRSPPGPSPNFASPISAISALTNTSTSSFQSIPIEMLSFEYVSNCRSPMDLQHIVDSLSANGPQHYPFLLRTAKTQLASINEQTVVNHESAPPIHLRASPEPQRDHALYISSTRDESSLALSLSSSMLDGVDISASLPNTIPIPASAKVNNIDQFIINKMNRPTASSPVEPEGAASTCTRHTVSSSACVNPATREARLQTEIEELSNQIGEMAVSNKKEQDNLQRRLLSLEEAKDQAEHKVSVLEKEIIRSSDQAREVNATLGSLREESRLLKTRLGTERSAAKSNMNQAKAVEEGLRRRIDSLSDELDQCKKQREDATKAMEMRARRHFEQECLKRDAEILSLQQSLQNAHVTLRAMKEERRNTLRSIHQALGKPTDRIDQLSVTERKETVDKISKKLNSSRAATKAMSKALNDAETDRKRLWEVKAATQKRLNESKSQCRRLERENDLLSQRIHEQNGELESSKVYIENILQQQARQYADRQMREAEYKEVIDKLKSQVRSGEAMVSLALYRTAVDEARARAIECQDKRLEINAISRKVQALEQRLKDDKSKKQRRPTPPESRPLRVNLRKVTPTSCAKQDENSDPQYLPKTPTGSNKHSKPPEGNHFQHPPLTPRMSAVREAGGRKGLCAKLKQMRRSPLVNKK